MPWEPKIFGALPASKISIPEDLQNPSPFGYIKLKVPGQTISASQQISFMNMRIHTRRLSPDEMKVMTAITPLGPRYYIKSHNWEQHEMEYKEFQAALRAKRRERVMDMLAEEIVRTKGESQPGRDLFS